MTYSTSLRALFSVSWIAIAACSSDVTEPDNAKVRLQFDVPDGELANPAALLDLDGGVMVAVGSRLLFVASGTNASTTVFEAPRFFHSLAEDATFVYFATQKADRIGHAFARANQGDETEPDGFVYRVTKAPPFVPEKLAAVNILSGGFSVNGGHLYSCESPGINGEGRLLDLPLTAPTTATHRRFRFNEFCRGVVATNDTMFLLMDRSNYYSMASGTPRTSEKLLVLATVDPRAAEPWPKGSGPSEVGTLTANPASREVDFFYVRDGGILIGSGASASSYSPAAGAPSSSSFDAGYDGRVAPLASANFVWSKAPDSWHTGTPDGSRACLGGRMFAGTRVNGAKELTQNVCDVRAMVVGKTELTFLEALTVGDDTMGKGVVRYRVKSLPVP